MRILVLTDSLADTDGVGRYTIRLMRAIERLRPNVQIEVALARKHPGLSLELPRNWPVKVCLPPDYFYYVSRARFHAYAAWSFLQLLPMARRADIVHAIKDYPHSYLGLQAARAAKKPCVMTAHGTYSVIPLSDARHGARARAAYPRFARILCVSEYTKKRILQQMPLSNLDVIKNAVDAEHYEIRPRLENRPWSGKRYTVGIGALKERKGHHVSIAAFLKVAPVFPELHHFVLGQFQQGDAYFEDIARNVKNAGCASRVHFLGLVPEDDKIDLLCGAEAFLHAPVVAADGGFEGFGIVYLEAAASGVPSIGTLDSGAEDAVVEGVTGYLVPPDPNAIAIKLQILLGDSSLRERLRESCLSHARLQNWDRNAERVLEVYDASIA
ncbi:MAG: glycosyltransferase family 4 protein [Planctomycetes bacterium]|nr:glycosyltransferase family 4 protein [Planctomycetota bacterium]